MSCRIRIPLLLDVFLVDETSLMEKLNDDRRVSRRLVASGCLFNEGIRRRIQSELRVGDRLLPVFAAREEPGRARRQEELRADLDAMAAGSLSRQADDVDRLATFVAGDRPDAPVGVVVQRIVGRCFDPRYEATPESYEAACTIDRWARADPITALWLRISGKLERAKALIWELARQDTHCIHGTAIAMHNIVATLENMRRAVRAGARPVGSGAAVLGPMLRGPASLARSCTAPIPVEGRRKPLRRGTLVIFQLEKIRRSSGESGLAFARGDWNECPAATLVGRLLEMVWEKAGRVVRAGFALGAGVIEHGGGRS